jgi:sorbitol-specific phosphotransferase system component IIC
MRSASLHAYLKLRLRLRLRLIIIIIIIIIIIKKLQVGEAYMRKASMTTQQTTERRICEYQILPLLGVKPLLPSL